MWGGGACILPYEDVPLSTKYTVRHSFGGPWRIVTELAQGFNLADRDGPCLVDRGGPWRAMSDRVCRIVADRDGVACLADRDGSYLADRGGPYLADHDGRACLGDLGRS